MRTKLQLSSAHLKATCGDMSLSSSTTEAGPSASLGLAAT